MLSAPGAAVREDLILLRTCMSLHISTWNHLAPPLEQIPRIVSPIVATSEGCDLSSCLLACSMRMHMQQAKIKQAGEGLTEGRHASQKHDRSYVCFLLCFPSFSFLPSFYSFLPSFYPGSFLPSFLPSCLSDVQLAATDRKWQNTCQNQCHVQKITSQNPEIHWPLGFRCAEHQMTCRNATHRCLEEGTIIVWRTSTHCQCVAAIDPHATICADHGRVRLTRCRFLSLAADLAPSMGLGPVSCERKKRVLGDTYAMTLGKFTLGVFGSYNCWQTVVPNSQTTLVRQRISIKLVVEANSGRSWVYDSHVCHWGQQGKHGLASGTPQTRASGTPQNRAGWWKHRKKRPW